MNSMDGNCRVILVLVSDNVTNVSTHNCEAAADNCKSNTDSSRDNKMNETDNDSNNNSNNGSENDKVRWHDKEAVLMHRGYHVVCMLPLLEFLDKRKYCKDKALEEQETCKAILNRCEYEDNNMEANIVTESNTTYNCSSKTRKIIPTLAKMENEILGIDEVVNRIRSFCTKLNIEITEISAETILQHVQSYSSEESGQASSLTETIEHKCAAIQTAAATTTSETVINSDNYLKDAAPESQEFEEQQLEVSQHTGNNNVKTLNKSIISAINNLDKSKMVTRVLKANVDDKQILFSSLFTIVPCHPSQLSMLIECLLDVNCFTYLTESNKSKSSYCGVGACNENNNDDNKNNNDSKEESSTNDEYNEKQEHYYPLLVVFDMTKQEKRSNHSLANDQSNNENSVCKEENEDEDDESEEDC